MNDAESIGTAGGAAHDGCTCVIGLSCGQVGSHREVAAAAAVVVVGYEPSEHIGNVEQTADHI